MGRGGKAVAHIPLDHKGVEVDVPQEAKAGDDAGEAEGGGLDVEDVDLQEVASFGTLHIDGASEGVDEAEVDAGEVGVGGGGVYLAVEGVAGLQDHLFAGVGLNGRRDVGVPAVVALGGFCGAGLGEVDLDGLHGGPPLI